MSGMDWLLEEDGSAAQPGDIVIYNKYVTRTVAVDSSADSAEPDLDDQFSVDTEFENSAELETSGASALDAAPAAEDAPAADSVITPISPTPPTRSGPPQSRWTAPAPLHPARTPLSPAWCPRCRAADHHRDRC